MIHLQIYLTLLTHPIISSHYLIPLSHPIISPHLTSPTPPVDYPDGIPDDYLDKDVRKAIDVNYKGGMQQQYYKSLAMMDEVIPIPSPTTPII